MSSDEKKEKEPDVEALKKQVEELRKQLKELQEMVKSKKETTEEREPTEIEQMKEAVKLLRQVGGFGMIGGLIDGIGNLVEVAEKIKDPKNPLHRKLNVEYSIRTSGILGDRYITSGGGFFAGAGRRGAPWVEVRRRSAEELRELRRLKEEIEKAEREREKEEKEKESGKSKGS